MYKHVYTGIFAVYGDIVAEETSTYFGLKKLPERLVSLSILLEGGQGDSVLSCCLFTPLDLLSTLAPPALCPGG